MIFEYLQRFGNLTNANNQITNIESLGFKYLGLYFTADWCRSCLQIAPTLKKLIPQVNKSGNLFHLITFRLDSTPSDFGYYQWKFQKSNQEQNGHLTNILKVKFLPSLLIFNSEGKLVSRNGFSDMQKHKENTIQYWDSL